MTAFNPNISASVKSYIYKSIASARNSKRLWLQGSAIEECGFKKGTPISVSVQDVLSDFHVVIRVDPTASKVVSGRTYKTTGAELPIIDFLSQDMAPVGTRIKVVVMPNLILVSLHHEDRKKLEREERLMQIASGKRVAKEGSLCTGIGVSTYAAHSVLEGEGIDSRLAWVVEKEDKYIEVAAKNNPAFRKDTVVISGVLEEVEVDQVEKVDFLSLSLPCTGFSLSGRAKLGLSCGEAHPEAATAVFGAIAIIKKSNPSVILSENVVQAQHSATYVLFKAELMRMGYNIHEVVLNGHHAGTLEQRERYFFVAVSSGVDTHFSFEPCLDGQDRPYATFADIMDDVPMDDPRWKSYDYLEQKAERDLAQGKGFKRQFINPSSTECGVIGRQYSKARSTEPFWKRLDGLQRLLTVAEHAKAKLIPESLVEGVSNTIAHEGLGQSVLFPHIVKLMRCIAQGIRRIAQAVIR